MGEIQKGRASLPTSNCRAFLEDWLDNENHALVRGSRSAAHGGHFRVLGNVAAQSKAKGRPRPVVDALRAATAFKRDLVLETRNVRDYEDLGVTILSHRRKYRLDLHRQPPYRRLPPLDYERPAVFKSSLRL
jgi:predicted nucleic acid-binding protein